MSDCKRFQQQQLREREGIDFNFFLQQAEYGVDRQIVNRGFDSFGSAGTIRGSFCCPVKEDVATVAAYRTRRTAGDTGCLLISGSPISLQLTFNHIFVKLMRRDRQIWYHGGDEVESLTADNLADAELAYQNGSHHWLSCDTEKGLCLQNRLKEYIFRKRKKRDH